MDTTASCSSFDEKAERLREIVRSLESCLVALSGGVDSTLLAKVCHDELGDRAEAVTARAEIHPEFELNNAKRMAELIGIELDVIRAEPFQIEGFAQNPPDRCYHCKRDLFGRLGQLAHQSGLRYVVDGANADDNQDFRPGHRAAHELGVRSPLAEAGMTKADVRLLSKQLGLPTWDRPSYACLASRFPYGHRITPEGLRMVDRAESALRDRGFTQSRVRHHDRIARIEVAPEELSRLVEPRCRKEIVASVKAAGFKYVTLDLEGYRSGSMDEVLTDAEKKG